MSWHLITQGDGYNSNYMEFLIDTPSDISNPPQEYNYSLASLAHTPGFTHIYESDANGDWVEVTGWARNEIVIGAGT